MVAFDEEDMGLLLKAELEVEQANKDMLAQAELDVGQANMDMLAQAELEVEQANNHLLTQVLLEVESPTYSPIRAVSSNVLFHYTAEHRVFELEVGRILCD